MNVRFNSMKTFVPKVLLAGSIMCATSPLAASAKSNNKADTFELQKTELIQHDNTKAITDSARSAELDSLRKYIVDLKQKKYKAERDAASKKESTEKYAKEKLKLAIEEYKTLTDTNVHVITEKEKTESEIKKFLSFLLGCFCSGLIIKGLQARKQNQKLDKQNTANVQQNESSN